MFARSLAAAGLALMLTQVPANASEISTDAEIATADAACEAMHGSDPAELVDTVADGVGDWLVWTKDRGGVLWLCNASSDGAVYANTIMQGDLLGGDGGTLINVQPVGNGSRFTRVNPSDAATALCSAVGSYLEDMSVVSTVEDGLGDYLVWLKNADDGLWLCNASSDAKLYDFEPVDLPVNDFRPTETRSA